MKNPCPVSAGLKEKIGIYGKLRVDVFGLPKDFDYKEYRDKSQNVSVLFHGKQTPGSDLTIIGKNVIVDTGRQRVMELIGGLSADAFTRMCIGDDGVSVLDILVPIAPTISDTDLNNKLTCSNVSSITVGLEGTPAQYYTRYVETFTASDYLATPGLPWNDPSKEVVNECGLFATDDTMLARKTFASIPFAPITSIQIRFTWEIFHNAG